MCVCVCERERTKNMFHQQSFCLYFVEGERSLNGHIFHSHTYGTPTRCDFCRKYMLGFIRQGLKCKSERIN